jgi:hypothetical protein
MARVQRVKRLLVKFFQTFEQNKRTPEPLFRYPLTHSLRDFFVRNSLSELEEFFMKRSILCRQVSREC